MRIEADLRRGLASELVGELETLSQQHPLRERPVAQLMHALYRAGRQAEALRAFERFRRRLGDELGIEPSPELRRLEEQILLHDSRPGARRGRAGSRRETATNPFKGLHAFRESDADDFFGRDRLVADVVGRGSAAVPGSSPSSARAGRASRASCAPVWCRHCARARCRGRSAG